MDLSTLRVLIGGLIAPGAPALAFGLLGMFFLPARMAGWAYLLMGIQGYFFALILGLPICLILNRRGVSDLVAYLVSGALLGIVSYVIGWSFFALVFLGSRPADVLSSLITEINFGLMAVAYAMVASVVFWLTAIRRN